MPSKSGHVLQDIINELGRRLEYEVTNGRYQGTVNAVGFDGIWRDPTGHSLIVEVKTTDTYRLSLDTLAGYRDQLKTRGDLAEPCSLLIIVGRTDTGELEAQVRGSRHAWDIRLISIDALLNLVRIKESAEGQDTIAKIRRLLVPLEYTRLDQLVDVVFTTTQAVETAVSADSTNPIESEEREESESSSGGWEFTPSAMIQSIRDKILLALGRGLELSFVKSREHCTGTLPILTVSLAQFQSATRITELLGIGTLITLLGIPSLKKLNGASSCLAV